MVVITTTVLLTTTAITIATAAATTTVVVVVLMARLLLLLLVLRRNAEPVPMVQQVRADLDVRLHLLVVLAGQIRADRGFPAAAAATVTSHLICTCASADAAAAIQSIRLTSLFVVLFHIG